jgi:hypothetical protein
MPPRFSLNTDLTSSVNAQLESILCLLESESLQFEPNSENFDFIKILAQIMYNFFQKFNKMKNNLIYAEMVKILQYIC